RYSDTGLVSGTTYTYRVAAANDGGLSDWSVETSAATEGYPPNAPSNLALTPVSGTQINLSWTDNSDNETGFRIQRRQIPTAGAPGSWLTIATVNANVRSFQNTNLIPGRTYAYRVIAFNNDGDATSNEASAVTPQTVPAAPSELTATAISGFQINLSWTDNSGTENGFRILRKASLSAPYVQLAEVLADVKAYQDTGLTPNTRYYYQVVAFNDVGVSTASNEASATTPVTPNAPGSLVATTISSTQINLSWSDNSTNETGFKIQRKTGTTGIWVEIGTVAANVRAFQNTGLTPGQTYVYRVLSFTSTSDSAPSNEASATTPVGVPIAPGNLQAITISFSQINLSWSDNSGNETGFIIRRKAGSAGTYADIATLASNVTSYQDTGLAASVTYYYVVVASNSNGNSAPSNEAFATTSAGGSQVPTAPSNLVATAVSSTQINLTWNDNSGNETGFRIRRRTGLDGAWSDIATTGLDTTSYADTGLTSGTTYYYSVRATNAVGDSALSNEANATTSTGSTTPLAPPSNLQVTAMTVSSTRLTWTDTSSAETGFRIQRRLGTAGVWGDVATVGANATSYEDTGLLSNSSYTYRVFAFNAGGSSDPSNEHSIIIPTFNFDVLSNGQPVSDAVGRNQSKYYRIYVPTGATELLVQTTGNNNVNLYVRYERQPQITANCRSEGASSAEQCRLVTPNPGDWHIQVFGGGNSTSNFTVTATFQGGGTVPVPGAPSALVATPVSSTQVNLTWLDGSTNETGFRIRRRLSSTTQWTLIATVDPNVISYSDTGLTPGSTYSYYVTAINVAGESANSNEAAATTPTTGGTAPAAPSTLVATTVSASQINLSWTDNSTNENGFRIRRKTGTGAYVDVATVAANVSTYQNTGLAASTTYVYQVIAFNDFGTSAGSNESTATTTSSGGGGTGTPAAASGLTVSAASTSTVTLSWEDNSTNESGFRIERRLGVGEWSVVNTVGANVKTWTDIGLISTATFTYRVIAFNANGSSTASEEKSVTVPSFNFTTISNNVSVTSSVSRSASRFYKINVPEGMAELIVETSGTFDPNLYLRIDRQPTEVAYNCRSINSGATERCRILTPVPGDWHIMVLGNSITTSNFTLTAKILEPVFEMTRRQD
ncbi:MAG: fibronectin type III domain-containing protein, partial [Acidobacteriota bacterium]